MKKLYLLIFLSIISVTAYGQFYYFPIGITAPYSGVKQTVCAGTTNTATSVTVPLCGTFTSTFLTLTQRWYLNNALVYAPPGSIVSNVGGAININLPAGAITFSTPGNYFGNNGLRLDLVLSTPMTSSCGPAGSMTVVGTPDSIVVVANPGAITGTNTVCPTSTTTLSNATAGGTWSSSATGIATVVGAGSNGAVTGVASGTAVITYNVSGCYNSRIVTVNVVPTAYGMTGGGSYCPGGTGVAVGLGNSNVGINYQLYNGSTPIGSAMAGTSGSLNFGLQLVGTYTVRGTNASTGCFNGMSGSAVVTLSPTVTPTVGISTSSSLICAGVLNTFNSTVVNGGSSPSYQWSVNGTPTGTSPSYSYLPTDGDIVSVQLTAAGGICPVPATVSNSYTVAVTPSAMPTITTSVAPDTHVCQGSTVMFTATSTFGGTAPIYRWNKNGINVATGPTYFYLPANGDVVFAQLYSNYNCRLADSVPSASTVMNVETPAVPPTVSIIATPGLNLGVGQADTFIAVAAGGTATHTYQWMINAVPVPGATSAMFVSDSFTHNDMVTCKVTNTDFCAKSTSKTVVVSVGTVGIETIPSENVFVNVYPNPNSGTFQLAGGVNATEATIEVSDLMGRSVYTNNINIQNNQLNGQIVLDNLTPGIYILNVKTAATNNTIRFSVSK
jgi:hypothetical protein